MKNFKIKINFIFLLFILSGYFVTPFIEIPLNMYTTSNQIYSDPALNQLENGDSSIITNDLTSTKPHLNQFDISSWEDMIQKLDKNGNGISDQFELKLNSLEKFSSSVKSLNNIKSLTNEKIVFCNKKKLDSISYDQIRLIIQFADEYNYTSVTSLFEKEKGIIKHTYKEAINGFAGKIDYDGLIKFCEQLKQYNIPFFIEEDGIVKANLYYASRNMNLRPYVWNTLGYTGDNDSSIAILDTGIDDSHEFFDNYSLTGNYAYKIVGWHDETATSATPIDDNGHGSHCAGIAAGVGTPVLDGSGRQVATSSIYEDFYPYAYIDDYSFILLLSSFNVTTSGEIEIECNFTDFTDGSDRIYGRAILYREDTQLYIVGDNSDSWEYNLTATVTPGEYKLGLQVTFDDIDMDADPYVWDPLIRFRGEIHWPFNPNPLGCGNYWKGVAPDTHLVGVKVLDESGVGYDTDIINGIQWIINNRWIYNITVISMSLGGSTSVALINKVNEAVNNGIVVVAAAGNAGPGTNYIGSPGDADNVITVAAMNYHDQVTSYSSQGGSSYTGNTGKPDIIAPGGSVYDINMFSADTNDNDAEGNFTVDHYADDLMPAQGTSMATPAIAGASSLVIQAMGGGNNWDWSVGSSSAKMVKAILCMTATETYGIQREIYTDYSPTLDRGGKDIHEGYGRINVDAAIEAWTKDLSTPSNLINISVWLNTSQYNPFGKHAYAGYVDLATSDNVVFNLTVPNGADYDLYLYNNTPNDYGEPVLIDSSTSARKGGNEIINFTATHVGKFFLVVKAIGSAIPSGGDDDDDDAAEKFDLIEFLASPLGLIIIGVSIVALIAIVVLIKKSTSKKDDYRG